MTRRFHDSVDADELADFRREQYQDRLDELDPEELDDHRRARAARAARRRSRDALNARLRKDRAADDGDAL